MSIQRPRREDPSCSSSSSQASHQSNTTPQDAIANVAQPLLATSAPIPAQGLAGRALVPPPSSSFLGDSAQKAASFSSGSTAQIPSESMFTQLDPRLSQDSFVLQALLEHLDQLLLQQVCLELKELFQWAIQGNPEASAGDRILSSLPETLSSAFASALSRSPEFWQSLESPGLTDDQRHTILRSLGDQNDWITPLQELGAQRTVQLIELSRLPDDPRHAIWDDQAFLAAFFSKISNAQFIPHELCALDPIWQAGLAAVTEHSSSEHLSDEEFKTFLEAFQLGSPLNDFRTIDFLQEAGHRAIPLMPLWAWLQNDVWDMGHHLDPDSLRTQLRMMLEMLEDPSQQGQLHAIFSDLPQQLDHSLAYRIALIQRDQDDGGMRALEMFKDHPVRKEEKQDFARWLIAQDNWETIFAYLNVPVLYEGDALRASLFNKAKNGSDADLVSFIAAFRMFLFKKNSDITKEFFDIVGHRAIPLIPLWEWLDLDVWAIGNALDAQSTRGQLREMLSMLENPGLCEVILELDLQIFESLPNCPIYGIALIQRDQDKKTPPTVHPKEILKGLPLQNTYEFTCWLIDQVDQDTWEDTLCYLGEDALKEHPSLRTLLFDKVQQFGDEDLGALMLGFCKELFQCDEDVATEFLQAIGPRAVPLIPLWEWIYTDVWETGHALDPDSTRTQLRMMLEMLEDQEQRDLLREINPEIFEELEKLEDCPTYGIALIQRDQDEPTHAKIHAKDVLTGIPLQDADEFAHWLIDQVDHNTWRGILCYLGEGALPGNPDLQTLLFDKVKQFYDEDLKAFMTDFHGVLFERDQDLTTRFFNSIGLRAIPLLAEIAPTLFAKILAQLAPALSQEPSVIQTLLTHLERLPQEQLHLEVETIFQWARRGDHPNEPTCERLLLALPEALSSDAPLAYAVSRSPGFWQGLESSGLTDHQRHTILRALGAQNNWSIPRQELGAQRTVQLIELSLSQDRSSHSIWDDQAFLAAFFSPLSNAQFIPHELCALDSIWEAGLSAITEHNSKSTEPISDEEFQTFLEVFQLGIPANEFRTVDFLREVGRRAIPMMPPWAWLQNNVWDMGHSLDPDSLRTQLSKMLEMLEDPSQGDQLQAIFPDLPEWLDHSLAYRIALIQRDQEDGGKRAQEILKDRPVRKEEELEFSRWLIEQNDWKSIFTHLNVWVLCEGDALRDLFFDKAKTCSDKGLEDFMITFLEEVGARAIPLIPLWCWIYPGVWETGHALDPNSTRIQLREMLKMLEDSSQYKDLQETTSPEIFEMLDELEDQPSYGIALIQRDQDEGTRRAQDILTCLSLQDTYEFAHWLIDQTDQVTWRELLGYLGEDALAENPDLQTLLFDKVKQFGDAELEAFTTDLRTILFDRGMDTTRKWITTIGLRVLPLIPLVEWHYLHVWETGNALDPHSARIYLRKALEMLEDPEHPLRKTNPEIFERLGSCTPYGIALIQRDQDEGLDRAWEILHHLPLRGFTAFTKWLISENDLKTIFRFLDEHALENKGIQDLLLEKIQGEIDGGTLDAHTFAQLLGTRIQTILFGTYFLSQFGVDATRELLPERLLQDPKFWKQLALKVDLDLFIDSFHALAPPNVREDAFLAQALLSCSTPDSGKMLQIFGVSVRKNLQIARLALQSFPLAIQWVDQSLWAYPEIKAELEELLDCLDPSIQEVYLIWHEAWITHRLAPDQLPDQLCSMPAAVIAACSQEREILPVDFTQERAFALFSHFVDFLEHASTPISILKMIQADEYFALDATKAYLSTRFPKPKKPPEAEVLRPYEAEALREREAEVRREREAEGLRVRTNRQCMAPLLEEWHTNDKENWAIFVRKIANKLRKYLSNMQANITQNRPLLGAPTELEDREKFYADVAIDIREVALTLQRKRVPKETSGEEQGPSEEVFKEAESSSTRPEGGVTPDEEPEQAASSSSMDRSAVVLPSNEEFEYWRTEWLQGLSASCRCAKGFDELKELIQQFSPQSPSTSIEQFVGDLIRHQLRSLIGRLCRQDAQSVHSKSFLEEAWQLYSGIPVLHPDPLKHPPARTLPDGTMEEIKWHDEFDLQMSPANLVAVAHEQLAHDARLAQLFDEWVIEHPPEELRRVLEPRISAHLRTLAQQYPVALERFEEDQDSYLLLCEAAQAALQENQTWLKEILPDDNGQKERILNLEKRSPGSALGLIPTPIRTAYEERLPHPRMLQATAAALNAPWTEWGGGLEGGKGRSEQPTLEQLIEKQRVQFSRQLYMEGLGTVRGLYANGDPHTSRDQIARVFRDLGIFKRDYLEPDGAR